MTQANSEQAAIRAKLGFATVDIFVEKYAPNVSKRGFFIKTAALKPPGTSLRFELRIEDGTTVLRGMGEVAWVRDSDDAGKSIGMGIRFEKVDAATRENIQRIVDYKKSRGITSPSRYSEAPPPASAASSTDRAELKKNAPRKRPVDVNLQNVDSLLANLAGNADRRTVKKRVSIPPQPSAADKAAADKAAADKTAADKAAADKAAADKAAADKTAAVQKASAALDMGKIEAEDHEIDGIISAFDDIQVFGDASAEVPGGQVKITATAVAGSMDFEISSSVPAPTDITASAPPTADESSSGLAYLEDDTEQDALDAFSFEDEEDGASLTELSDQLQERHVAPKSLPDAISLSPPSVSDVPDFDFLKDAAMSSDGASDTQDFSDGDDIEEISVTEYDVTASEEDFFDTEDSDEFAIVGEPLDEDEDSSSLEDSGFLDADAYVIDKDLLPSIPPATAPPDDEDRIIAQQGWNRDSLFSADITDAVEELGAANADSGLDNLDDIEDPDEYEMEHRTDNSIDKLIGRATQETRIPASPAKTPLLPPDDGLDSVIDGIFARGTINPAVADDAPDELPDDALPANLAAHLTRRRSLPPPPPMEQYVSDDTVIPDDGDSSFPHKRKGFLGKLFGKK